MVTRRAVLRGTAAASIGAIAAAHGAAPVEAASLDIGFGQLTGGAVGGFSKHRDGFHLAVKFKKAALEFVVKEQPSGGVAVFAKFFHKGWTPVETELLSSELFKDLQTSELNFSKIEIDSAEFFLKDQINQTSLQGTFEVNSDGVFYKLQPSFPEGEIG